MEHTQERVLQQAGIGATTTTKHGHHQLTGTAAQAQVGWASPNSTVTCKADSMPSTSAAPSIQMANLLAKQAHLMFQLLNLLQFLLTPNALQQAGTDARNTMLHGHHHPMGSAVQEQDGLELPPLTVTKQMVE